jgi:hypothetical protein
VPHDGPRCTWAASFRTRRPRSTGDRPGSASGRISEYRYSAISRARSARDFLGSDFDIRGTSTLSVVDDSDASTLTHRGDRSQTRARVDRQHRDRRRVPAQPPAARTRRHHLRRRHLEHRRTHRAAHRRAPGADLRDRVCDRVPGRHQAIHVRPGARARVPFQPREPDPDRLGVRGEPRQPPAHRRGRPARRRTDPPPTPTRRPRHQRRPDHAHHIDPPAQAEPGQQHVRAATPTRPRTDPPPRPDPPHRRAGLSTNRGAACPHGANRPPQAGHASSPQTSCVSTRTGSGPTLTNGPPPGAFERPFPTARQRIREGPLTIKITPSLSSRPHHDATIRPSQLPHPHRHRQ